MSSPYNPNASSAYSPGASAPSKSGSNKTGIIIAVIVCAILIVVGIIVGVVVGGAASSDDASSSTSYIDILVQSSNTKEKWMELMVTRFNSNSSANQYNGKTIRVTLKNTGSSFKNLKQTIWSPANTQYITLYEQENKTTLLSSEATYCQSVTDIPVGVAMWRKLAESLGWEDNTAISFERLAEIALDPLGWASVDATVSAYEDFKYAHGHPDESNSGRLSVVANMLALSDATIDDGLTISDVEQAVNDSDVQALEQAVVHLGKIDTAILERMLEHGPTYIHAVANYESNVINWNLDYEQQMTQWNDDWVFIYLADGTFWINHPLCVLDQAGWVSEEQKEAGMQFIKWATRKQNLQELLQFGIRPTSSSGITDLTCCGSTITKANGADPTQDRETVPQIPYPDDDVMTAVLEGWHLIKRPAAFALVVDTSGSMNTYDEGESLTRLEYARAALFEFVDSMDPQDYIMPFKFRDDVGGPQGLIGDPVIASQMDTWIQQLRGELKTPLYTAIATAFNAITELKAEKEAEGIKWNYAIVAMTDGDATDYETAFQSTCQLFTTQAGISSQYCNLNAELEGAEAFSESSDIVHFFPIVFGQDPGAIEEKPNLRRMAQISSGANFSADSNELSDTYYLISLEL